MSSTCCSIFSPHSRDLLLLLPLSSFLLSLSLHFIFSLKNMQNDPKEASLGMCFKQEKSEVSLRERESKVSLRERERER